MSSFGIYNHVCFISLKSESYSSENGKSSEIWGSSWRLDYKVWIAMESGIDAFGGFGSKGLKPTIPFGEYYKARTLFDQNPDICLFYEAST